MGLASRRHIALFLFSIRKSSVSGVLCFDEFFTKILISAFKWGNLVLEGEFREGIREHFALTKQNQSKNSAARKPNCEGKVELKAVFAGTNNRWRFCLSYIMTTSSLLPLPP